MPVAFKARNYREVNIVGYETKKIKDMTFEKLKVTYSKKDGSTTRESSITITDANQMLLMGIQKDLEPLIGPIATWKDQRFNPPIKAKVLMLKSKNADETEFPELARHETKATIIKAEADEPDWTMEEIDNMRPKKKEKKPAMESAPPTVSNEEF